MAFDFLGSINSIEKFEEFEEFIRIEANNMERKIQTLLSQKVKYQQLLDKYKQADQIQRQGYEKAERADIDFIKRARTQPNVYKRYIDAYSSIATLDLKKFTKDAIKAKRERNEYNIKKIRDLIEQTDNEIAYIEEQLELYEDNLNQIRSRFDNPDFPELQRVAPVDQKDVDDTIPVTPRDLGRENINGTTFYLCLTVQANTKRLIFEGAAPSVKPNQQINLINGQNNGIKTVRRVVNEKTIEVFEDLVDEAPSPTKASIV